MKRLALMVTMVAMLSIGLWTLDPIQSFAQRHNKASMTASAHVSGVVIGKQIRNESGVVLGTVENVVLNDSGCAQYVILSGKFRGARSRLYPIPWAVIARTGPDAIFVDFDPAYLVQAPSFEVGRWPDFSQAQWQTQIRTFYEKRAHRAEPGTVGKTPGAARSEDKAKTEREMRAKERQWRGPATEGTVRPEDKAKDKSQMERGLQQRPSEMGKPGGVESPKPGELKKKEQQQKPDTSGMMERGRGQMMERGKPQMMERGKGQMMERGQVEKAKPEHKSPSGDVGAPSAPGQTEQKMK